MADAVIIDNGSGMIKAGFSSDKLPRVIIPNVVGRPQSSMLKNTSGSTAAAGEQELYVAQAALDKRAVLKLTYPVAHGIVEDWESMEKIWENMYLNLRTKPEEHPALVTEAAMNPKVNREKLVQILFESFDVPACYVAVQAILSLFSSGRTTGCVLDSGDGVTHTVPVYEGYAIRHAVNRLNIAGRDVTEYLGTLINKSKGLISFASSAERQIMRDLKEKHCYIRTDIQTLNQFGEFSAEEETKGEELAYELPDGQHLYVGEELWRAPEILFHPSLVGKDLEGIHKLLNKSITQCDIDLRRPLYENILLSGGTTLIKNVDVRLKNELVSLVPEKMKVNVKAFDDRYYSVFVGGAVLASLPTFDDAWIYADEYDESGASIVHRKCF
jgi:actin-related protein